MTRPESTFDYKSAGVNIDAGNEAVERIKQHVRATFGPEVLTGLGSFGSLFDLKPVFEAYQHPVLVQSIDGVGTKVMIAALMDRYNTIGMDLVAACCNDIAVLGARPLTFLDYIANDALDPAIVEIMVKGMAEACAAIGVALVGGETAEMPGTYLPGEHDLVGIVTGVVEKDQIITGKNIRPGDVVLGLPSSGLHTNGFSLARKIIFDAAGLKPDDTVAESDRTIGELLLEPHINYTNMIKTLLDNKVDIHGMAHITGGGLVENIPRILPEGCAVKIDEGNWPSLPIFRALERLGNLESSEMYRVFNMGIGLTLVLPENEVDSVKHWLHNQTKVFVIGAIIPGNRKVIIC
ncbi:MAG: phosphoribosylformylglycinamidine cyclo-ligase [Fidelibacterota bacterium]